MRRLPSTVGRINPSTSASDPVVVGIPVQVLSLNGEQHGLPTGPMALVLIRLPDGVELVCQAVRLFADQQCEHRLITDKGQVEFTIRSEVFADQTGSMVPVPPWRPAMEVAGTVGVSHYSLPPARSRPSGALMWRVYARGSRTELSFMRVLGGDVQIALPSPTAALLALCEAAQDAGLIDGPQCVCVRAHADVDGVAFDVPVRELMAA